MLVAASTVAIVAIAAAVIVVALLAWYVLPRGGRFCDACHPTLAEAERNIAEAEKIAALWREIADVLRRTNGHSNGNGKVAVAPNDTGAEISEGPPRGREAVRRIVADRPGVWNLRDIADKALALGWASDRKNIELDDTGGIVKFCFRAPSDEPRFQSWRTGLNFNPRHPTSRQTFAVAYMGNERNT